MENTNINKGLITDCINIYIDTLTLLHKLPSFLQFVESKVLNQKSTEVLKLSMLQSEQIIQENKAIIKECIVKELFGYLNIQLKQVSDIPRLYRKTNRSVPSKPCSYIDLIVKTIMDFREDSERRLDNAFLVEIFESLFNTMTKT